MAGFNAKGSNADRQQTPHDSAVIMVPLLPPVPRLMPGPISRYLPARFANGNSISRFAKHCPQCKTLVPAEHIEGEAVMVQDRLFVVAEACCPQCQTRFKISCVITDDKRVHRALLPQWLLRLWLKQATPTPQPAQDAKEWDLDLSPPATPAPLPGVQLPEGVQLQASDEVIGRYDNAPIPASVSCGERRFVFARVQPNAGGATLADNELLFGQHLIYREEQA